MANLDNIARGAIRLFAGLLLTCWACAALAEGTRTLYPAAYPAAGFRADLDLTGGTYGGVTTRRQFIYVYANAGEYILLGSSNRNNGGDIFVYNPQSFGAKGAETIPSTANFTCSAVAAGPNYGGGTRGFLDTRANELLGPKSADGTTGSGFTPCSYLAPSTGIYGVSFTVATAGGTGPTGSVATLHPGSVTVPGWDVAVRNGVTSTTDINARVFTYAYVAFTGGNNLPLYTTLYYATLDGVRYQQTLQGFDPNGFALWANVAGFLDNGQPLYKDIRAADAQITPGGGQFIAELSAQTPQMPVFFNTIDPAGANAASATTVLQALGIPLSPPIPQLSSVSFTGAQSGNTTYVSAGGTFQFTTMDDTTYQIVISRDGVDFDPGTPTNAALTGLAPDGVNTVLWNGLASDGSTFPASATPYQYKVVGRNGEIHFPIIDDEGNKFGGPTLTKLNGGSVGDHTAFYDDRGYRTRNGVLIGVAPDGLLCPGNPPIPPTPDHSLIGQDSNANTFSGANCNGGAGTCYYRYWPGNGNSNADCAAAAGFGDAKALDLWSYQQTPITTQTVIIDPQPATAKVATSVSVPPTAGPGSTVNGSFVFENVGGTSATGTTYTVQIGTPGSCPAGVTFLSPPGVTFTFNAATCTYTLTSPPATLPAGQQLNFNFSYTAPASGSVPVTTNINSTNGGSATATGTTQIIAADVTTTVTVPASAAAGSTVSGTITFSNAAGATATANGVAYNTTIGTPGSCPAGVTFTSLPPGVTATYNSTSCQVTYSGMPASLTAGQTLSIGFQYTGPATAGTVPVSSSISTTTPESNAANNTASGSTTFLSANLSITKTDGTASVNAGATVTYTIVVSNAGPSAANGAIFQDPAVANLVVTNVTCGSPTGGAACPTAGNTTVALMQGSGIVIPTLPSGGSVTFTVTGTAGATGNIVNTATVTAPAGVSDPNAANNSATDTDTINPVADLSISKTDGVASVAAGSIVTYTIVVSNAGPSAANNAIFQDPAVANLTVTNVTCGSVTGGAACPLPGSTTVVLMQSTGIVIPTLPSGGSVTFTVTGTAGASGTITNSAMITAPSGVIDPVVVNNLAADTDPITPAADLSISKTDGVTSVNAGATVTYTIIVSNAGPSGANGATFKDSAVGNLTVTNVTCGSASGGAACPAAGSTTVALMQGAGITIPTLPSGGSVTFTVTGTAGGSGTIANSAMVTAPAGVTDPTLVNNASTDTDTINPVADLSITKTDGVTTATPGGSVTYTITASNAGPSAVVGATVADTFPAAITSATWTCAGAGGGTCPASGSGNINLSVNLPVGGSVTFTVTANISPSATGTLSNTATVTAPAGVTDPTPGNNTATDSDTLNPVADLSITKTDGTTTYTPGATTTYTIVATNNGPSAVTGATITDTFGASFTADTWTATATGGASGFTASGSGNINDTVNMPVGSTITYTVSATISLAATGNVSNTATIAVPAGVSDPTPGNNSATDTDTNDGTQQLSISKSATPAAFAVGQSGTYSLLVSNTGTTSTAGAISISDPLPSGITTSATPSGTGWNCSASTATAVSCTTAAVLLPGGNAPVISVPITVGVGASPAVTNTATVQGGGDATCPAAAHCQSTITTPVNAALINVTKTLSGSLVVGVQTNYVITATNNGQAATLAGTITDTIPTGLTIGTLPAGCSASGQNLTCTLPAGIATGGSISYTIPVTPQSSVNGTNVSNTATDNGGGDPSCPAAGHCNGTTTNTVTAPQLSLTKSATPSTFVVNQPATYTLTLTNTGTAATTATTTISDAIPGGLTIGTLPAGCTATGQTVTCTVSAPLNTGTPVTFNIPVTPTNALNGTSVTNTAGATGGGDPGCPNGPPVGSLPARCVGSVTTAVNAPQLSIQKTASAPSFVVGVGASYTLQVTNTGSAATNASATVTDVIPASLTIGTLPAGCTATGQQVTCTIAGGLATGTSVSFVIPVTPTASAVPSVSNTATVQGGGDPTCPITANCKSTITTPVNAPQLSIQKTASAASFVVGVGASYTLQVTNTGTAATTATATVTDNIPGTLTIGTLAAGCTAAGQTVTCTIASGLATGNSVSFVIPVTPTPAANGTTLSNTATVMGGGDPTCPGGANCSSTVTTPVNAPALKVVKTASASNFFVGVAASYTLQVTNTGSAATTATTTITDNIPGTLTIGTLPAGCTNAGQTVICTIAAGLATGSPVSFVIPVTPTAAANGTTLSNTATVSGGGDPACPGGANCSSTVTTPVNAPALQIVKTASSPTFTVGVAASYTLTVTNIGGAATTATTTATDNIPSTLTIGTLPAGCSAAGQVVTCTIAAGLATNSPVSFVIPVTPTPTANGTTLSNTATVSGGGDPSCPNQNNANCSSTVDTPVNQPALRVQKTASAPGFVVGTPASYSLTVTNIGSAATTAVTTVTDNIPSTLAVGALPAGCTAFGQVVTCTIAAGLATNTPVSFVIPVTPTAAANGTTVVNTATVSGGGDPSCPSQSNANCSSTVTTPVSAPALGIVKTASSSSFTVNVPASYTLTVTNIGGAATTAVATVSDNIPGTLTIGTLPAGCSASGQAVTCTIASGLAAGVSRSFVIPVTPAAAASGATLSNTATVSGGGDPSCPAGANCSSTVTTPVGAPRLQIVKTASGAAFAIGVPASYTLTVTNTGNAATTAAATITDNIYNTLTIGTLPAGCSASGQQVTCTIAAGLAPNAAASFAVPVTPTAAAGGTTVTNTAVVSGGGDPSCPAGSNCSSTVSTPVPAAATSADLRIVKTGPVQVTAGQNIVYTVSVTNTGPDTALNVVLSDPTPAGLSFVSSGAPCASFPCSLGNLTANQTVTISNVTFYVPTNYAGNSVTNVASVTSATPDPTPNNNSSSVSTTILPAATQSAAAVPINSRWMLLMMVLLLVGLGIVKTRAHR